MTDHCRKNTQPSYPHEQTFFKNNNLSSLKRECANCLISVYLPLTLIFWTIVRVECPEGNIVVHSTTWGLFDHDTFLKRNHFVIKLVFTKTHSIENSIYRFIYISQEFNLILLHDYPIFGSTFIRSSTIGSTLRRFPYVLLRFSQAFWRQSKKKNKKQ